MTPSPPPPAIALEQITGLVLAGGRGARMGRVDKGLMPFRGATLAAHVLRRLAPQVGQAALNANQNLASYQALGAPVWPDLLAGFEGPLAGLQAGLRHCATPYLVCVPCDSPFLPDDLVTRLAAALQAENADLAIAVTGETGPAGATYQQAHPVFCLMKLGVLAELETYLAGGGRRMDGWHGALTVARVPFSQAAAFRNINTLDALRHCENQVSSLAEAVAAIPGYNPDALPVEQARNIIAACIRPLETGEQVALRAALGRVLAADVRSPINVPGHDNSAMDGYALRSADLPAGRAVRLQIAATVHAGHPATVPLEPGQCARIMTGGLMPAGCDSVLPQELVQQAGDGWIEVAPGQIKPGANRRHAGEDLAAGALALKKGQIVRPAELGLLASLGITEVAVTRRPRVAFFSTGDELRPAGQPLAAGCVYDSNRYTLFGMLSKLGCEAIDLGIVPDQPHALEAALRQACAHADVVITSGGMAAGAADHTRPVTAALGDVRFWSLAMRPGRPLAFGKISADGHAALLFGLPGNPVAVMVSFYFFVREALLRLMGAAAAPPPLLRVASRDVLRKRPGRTEYQRGIVSPAGDGRQQVHLTGAQGSGILSSMSEANCIIILPEAQGDVAAGALVDVVLFDGLI